MKYVALVGKESFILKERDIPEACDGEVVVEVRSCGICGTDINRFISGHDKGIILGHEISGSVIDSGSEHFSKGDKVIVMPLSPCGKCSACLSGNINYCEEAWDDAIGFSKGVDGGFSEYICVKEENLKKIPSSISYEVASMIEPLACALHAINLANIKVGDSVLIVGAGTLGLLVSEFASMNGATYVSVMEINKKRGKKAINYGKIKDFYDANHADTIPNIITRTNGGFDNVICTVSNSKAILESIECVRPGGDLILLGYDDREVTLPISLAVKKEVRILTSVAYSNKEFMDSIKLVSERKVNVSKYIDDEIKLEDLEDKFIKLCSDKNADVKVIVKP